MIEDFDGPEPAPSARGHVLVLSVLLLVGIVAGYAAVSSPELRGPYATPRPSVVNAPHFTPAPVASLVPAAISVPFLPRCPAPDSVRVTTVVPGTPLWLYDPAGQLWLYDPAGQAITSRVPSSVSNACAVIWGQPPSPIPYDRVSR